jgi:23S rRNA (cytosine1962-C5)-methyltransferase
VSRPDPQALWSKNLPENRWKEAQAVFKDGKWKNNKDGFTENWKVTLSNVTCNIKLSPFKHLGIFPEQSEHWTWLQNLIKNSVQNRESKISVLNLFGYTGGASIAAAKAGAEVTHVDSSESSVKWAKLNRNASDLREDSIRFIVEDIEKLLS